MHEFSMGEEVAKAVLAELDRLKPTVVLRRVRMVVGALHRVDPESLRLAYEVGTRDTRAAGSSLEITVLPVLASCRDCGWQGGLEDILFLCGKCGGVNLQTLQGWELSLAEFDVEDETIIN